jgi:hypothetical protein
MSWALGYELDWDKMVQFAVEVNLRPDLGPDDEARLFHASLLDIQKQTGYTCGTTLCLRGQDLVHVFTLRTMSSPSPRRFAVTLKKVGPVEHFEKLLDVLGVTKPPMWFVVLTNNVDENMDRAPGLTIKELLHVVDKYMGASATVSPISPLSALQPASVNIFRGAFVSGSSWLWTATRV